MSLLGAACAAPRVSGVEPSRGAPKTPPGIAAVQQPKLSSAKCARRETLPIQRQGADTSSSVALLRAGGRSIALVADEDQQAIATIDLQQRRQIAVTPLGASPAHVLVLKDGRVAITLKDANRVALFELTQPEEPLALRCSSGVPSEPFALAEAPNALLVTSAWDHRLSALSPQDLTPRFSVALEREPRAILIDGERAFVSHAMGSRVSVVDLRGDLHQVRRISLDVDGAFSTRKLTQGYALALARLKGGVRLFAPGAGTFPGDPVISHGYGSFRVRGHVPLVALIDPKREQLLTRFSHDGPGAPSQFWSDHVGGWGEECILPRAAAARGERLYVACQGTDTLLQLDARAADPIRVELQRFPLPSGPTGLAVGRDQAVVWSQFAGELALVDLTKHGRDAVTRITTWRTPHPRYTAQQLKGRALFHRTFDLRFSLDGRTCASCHPDGRDDGLTWSTSEGPRQSIMLAGRAPGSAPFGWFGNHKDLDQHLEITFHSLGGRGLDGADSNADLAALKAWLAVMPAPHRAETSRNGAEYQRGAALFFSAETGCASCHVGGGSDKQLHDVKSGRAVERSNRFDTPTLRFVSGTAPYFHDGRYATLPSMLRATDTRMGHSAQLPEADIQALATFLGSLDGAAPVRFSPESLTSDGWQRTSAALPMAKPKPLGTKSLAKLERTVHPPQPAVHSQLLDLSALPLYEVAAEDKRFPRPTSRPSEQRANNLEILFQNYKHKRDAFAHGGDSARLAIKDRSVGWIQLALDRQPVRANSKGGVMGFCGNDFEFYSGVRWQTLKMNPDGKLAFDSASGWLSRRECEVWVTERVQALAPPIIPGLVYGFLTHCAGCATQKLHLVTPEEWGHDGFEEHVLELERGSSEDLGLALGLYNTRRWKRLLGVQSEFKRPILGVQVSWAADEAKPLAVAYVADR